ncbi:hypothetical protein [Kineococcus sp. SYSU DK002]|uniref:hypothetical protein n=1 Tax=Kineococcus sp. SYSU DK002 TaxID=3383123 RepID=UPI003D7CB129
MDTWALLVIAAALSTLSGVLIARANPAHPTPWWGRLRRRPALAVATSAAAIVAGLWPALDFHTQSIALLLVVGLAAAFAPEFAVLARHNQRLRQEPTPDH